MNESVDGGYYLRVLRRRWYVVALGALIGLVAAVAFAGSGAPSTTAKVSVEVVLPETSSGAVLQGVMTTEQEFARSTVVAARAAELLDTNQTADDLRDQIAVDNTTGSAILNFRSTGRKANDTTAVAQAFADAYLAERSEQQQADRRDKIAKLRSRIGSLTDSLQEAITAQAEAEEDSSEFVQASTQQTLLVEEISGLQDQVTALVSVSDNVGSIVTVVPADQPSKSPAYLIWVLGLAAGGLVAAALAFVVDRSDHRVRSDDDLERLVGSPVLADVSGDNPETAYSRAAAVIAARHQAANLRSLLLVAAIADPDLAQSPVRLARALTDNGLRVLLVEADRRGGTVDKAFGLSGRPGLEDIIGGVAGVRPVQPEPQLYVLPSGTNNGDAPRPFTPGILKSLVDSASQWADLVVVHTPVGVDEPDTLRLAGSTGGVVVGTRGAGADREEVQRAVALLDGVGARIVGLLTVDAKRRIGGLRRGSGH